MLWVESLTQEYISSVVGPYDSDYLKSNKGKEQWICGSEKVEHGGSMETNVKIKQGSVTIPRYGGGKLLWLLKISQELMWLYRLFWYEKIRWKSS